jgi:Ca-activated chloride channel family protein
MQSITQARHLFTNPLFLGLLALLPVLTVFAVRSLRRRRRALEMFGGVPALVTLSKVRSRGQVLRALCLFSGLLFVVLGIAGPRWGRGSELSVSQGRDLVVAIDVSRSMLAQDVLPSRFDRAKEALQDLSYTVQKHGGHRLGLVAFAARPRLICPLTQDYDHFRDALGELNAADPSPDLTTAVNAALSGTRIGAGLQAAIDAHDPRSQDYQEILLLSDGDDPVRDEEWKEGAVRARDHKIPVHTIGIGDPVADSTVPSRDGTPLRYKNRLVQTRLQEEPLQEIARWTGGTYTPARTSALPLGQLFLERIEPAKKQEVSVDALPSYQQRYPWFLGAGLLFLGLEMVVGQARNTLSKRGW